VSTGVGQGLMTRRTRAGRRGNNDLDLSEIADELAESVSAQWQGWMAARSDLADPLVLRLRWESDDPTLAAALRPGVSETVAGDADDLADVVRLVPSGRILFLGPAGAGKSALMARLVLKLLSTRRTGETVPVLAPAGTWDPSTTTLRAWIEARLCADYPPLAQSCPPGGTAARHLLDAGLILPILDGLDEIAFPLDQVIMRITADLRPADRFVTTCRAKPFADAVRSPGATTSPLTLASVIRVQPIDISVALRYLQAAASDPNLASRWSETLSGLSTEAPLARVLSRPIMTKVARAAACRPRP
jgi:hypothetical protein